MQNPLAIYVEDLNADGRTHYVVANIPSLRRGVTCVDGHMVRAITAEWYGCEALSQEALLDKLRADG